MLAEHSHLGEILATVPDEKLSDLYRFSLTISDRKTRLSLQEAMRPRLRAARLPRAHTPIRHFCLAFESLLCNRAPKVWQIGRIPRAVIMPLWQMILERAKDAAPLVEEQPARRLPVMLDVASARHPLFDAALQAIAALRQQAAKDERLRVRGTEICPGFWDSVAAIEDVIRMRFDLIEGMSRVESLPFGRLEASQAEPVLAVARRAAAGTRQRLVLFFLILAKQDGLAPKVLELCNNLGGSAGSAIFGEIARTLSEDLREDLDRLSDTAEGRDLHLFIGDFESLGERISAIKEVALGRRDVHDLHAAFKEAARLRFTQATDRLVERARHSAETGAPLPDDFIQVLEALTGSQPFFVRLGFKAYHRRKAAEVMNAVEAALGRVARGSIRQAPEDRIRALDSVIGSAHALEPLLGTAGTLSMLRGNFAHLAGKEPAAEPDKFLIQVVEFRNRDLGRPQGSPAAGEPSHRGE